MDVMLDLGWGVAGAIRSQWLKTKADIETKNLNDKPQPLNVPRPDQEIYSAIGLAIGTVIGLTIDLIGDLMYLKMK